MPSSTSLFSFYPRPSISALAFKHVRDIITSYKFYGCSLAMPPLFLTSLYNSLTVILPASVLAPWVWLIEQRELACEKLVRSCHSSAYSSAVTSHSIMSENQNTMIWSSPFFLNSPSTLPFVHSTAIIAFLHNCQLIDIVLFPLPAMFFTQMPHGLLSYIL